MTKARQGLPHLKNLSDQEIQDLVIDGKIFLGSVTEKTDGASFVLHYDENGFGTQSSGSGTEIMRVPEDYIRRATRNGKTTIAKAVPAFMRFHEELMNDKELLDVLKKYKIVRGEVFLRDLCRPSTIPGESIIVGTSYRDEEIGSNGTFIIHTMLPDNKGVDPYDFIPLSGCTIRFDHDRVEFNKVLEITPSFNIDMIKERIEQELLGSILPKWGSETEGYVVHPSRHNPKAKPFKVISDRWSEYFLKSKRFTGISIVSNNSI